MEIYPISQIKKLANKHALDFVVIFGSQARRKIHQGSDVDIAIISHEKIDIPHIAIEFSDILGRDDVEIIDLAKASPTLMHAVVRDGRLIYEKEKGDFLRWKVYASKIWMETAWLRNLRDLKLLKWAKKQEQKYAE